MVFMSIAPEEIPPKARTLLSLRDICAVLPRPNSTFISLKVMAPELGVVIKYIYFQSKR
jgi:hypothetical protein